MEYTLGDDEAISGLYSYHSNKKEDRLWSIEVCKLRKKCKISKIQYYTVVSDVTSEEVFAGRQSFDNRNGQSDNSFTDKRED